jgi:hypothetical protein
VPFHAAPTRSLPVVSAGLVPPAHPRLAESFFAGLPPGLRATSYPAIDPAVIEQVVERPVFRQERRALTPRQVLGEPTGEGERAE